MGGNPPADKDKDQKEKEVTHHPLPCVVLTIQKQKPKWEPPPPARIGKKKRRGPNMASKLPTVTPTARCKLRLLKQLRIKDYLLLEEEVVALYQARAKRKELEDGNKKPGMPGDRETDDETMLAQLKGSPLGVGQLEEVSLPDKANQGKLINRLLMMITLL